MKEFLMKSLVVYFSLDGHTRLIADIIASETGADTHELKPVNEKARRGFAKFFWGGKSVIFNEKPKLQALLPDISAYDVVFIGTPIWASSFAPPVNTFLSNIPNSPRSVMLFACCSGGSATKCFDKMKVRLTSSKILGEITFIDPTSKQRETLNAQIKDWLNNAGLKK
jgi:flavodoxin